MDLDPQVRLRDSSEWLNPEDLELEVQPTWEELLWDFSGLDEIAELAIEFKFSVPFARLVEYEVAYSMGTIVEDLAFGARIKNKSARRREWVAGTLSVSGSGNGQKLIGTLTRLTSIGRPLKLDEFSGEIEIEPLLIVDKSGGLYDRARRISVPRQTIIGWSEPVVVILDRSRKGLGSLFDFKWIRFSEYPAEFDPQCLFSVDWSQRPVLFLNQDVDLLKSVLMGVSKVGRAARTRQALEVLIAQPVLTSVVSAAVMAARQVASGDSSIAGGEVLEILSPQDRALLREWLFIFDARAVQNPEVVLEEVLAWPEEDLLALLSAGIQRQLQVQLSTKKVVADLLNEIVGGE